MFKYKTIDQIKELFAKNKYTINEINKGLAYDQSNIDIYNTSFSFENKINREYTSEKTILTLDNMLNILVPVFNYLNPKSIINTAKGEFIFCNSNGNKQVKFPFIALIESNSYVYIIKDMCGIKQMEFSVPSFSSMSLTQTLVFSVDKIEIPKRTAPLVYGEVKDIEGNAYKTISIGTQTWMAENLKTTKYNDNSSIQILTDNLIWDSLSTPGYCWYKNNKDIYGDTYGALYNWFTVNTAKLCPTGRHVTNDNDWTILQNFLIANGYNYGGVTVGNYLGKSLTSSIGWESSIYIGGVGNKPETNNSSGFSALPGSGRFAKGIFNYVGYYGYWWSATEKDINYGNCLSITYGNKSMCGYSSNKSLGYCVRCVKDYYFRLLT